MNFVTKFENRKIFIHFEQNFGKCNHLVISGIFLKKENKYEKRNRKIKNRKK